MEEMYDKCIKSLIAINMTSYIALVTLPNSVSFYTLLILSHFLFLLLYGESHPVAPHQLLFILQLVVIVQDAI